MNEPLVLNKLTDHFLRIARHRFKLDLPEIAKYKFRLENDLFFFGKEVVKNERLGRIHKDLSDRFKYPWSRLLLLWPRDHLKSTFANQLHCAQILLREPNARILIASYSIKLAKPFLRGVQQILLHPDVTRLYGNQEGPIWSQNEILVSTRYNPSIKEPSITLGALDAPVTSGHYDYIILDDLINTENYKSPDQLEAVWDFYLECLNLLDKVSGHMLVIGTRWSDEDLYGRIIKRRNKLKTDAERDRYFELICRQIEEDGEILLPEIFTEEIIENLKNEYIDNLPMFYGQYYNDPSRGKLNDFQDKWYKPYHDLNVDSIFNCAITIDPAYSKKKHADSTGIVVGLIDQDDHVWIEEAIGEKLGIDGTVDKIFELYKKYNAMPFIQHVYVGCEAEGLQASLLYGIKQKMKADNFQFNITPLSHKYKAKIDRIRAMQPFYRVGRVHHKVGKCAKLEHELKWLGTIHPDIADALAYQPSMWVKPYKAIVQEVTQFGKWIKEQLETKLSGGPDWYERPSGR